MHLCVWWCVYLPPCVCLCFNFWSNNVFIESEMFFYRLFRTCMSAVCSTDRSLLIQTAGHFSKPCLTPKTDTYRYTPHAYLCVHRYFAHSSMRSSRCMDKKSLNQWVKYGGVHARRHTLARALTVACVCESELSVLLSHTIHHKLLILLDHCRAFRTPRCSLKTQSEANAPNPPNTHTHASSTLSFLLTHVHTRRDPEGTAVVLGDPTSPTL